MRSRTLPVRALLSVAGVLLLGGCAVPPLPAPPGPDHPANAQAAEAPLPVRSDTLAINDAALPRGASPADMKSEMDMQSTGGMKHDMGGMKHDVPATSPTTSAALYTCPMHKQIVSDQPGNCPICSMKLVPKKSGETAGHADHGEHP